MVSPRHRIEEIKQRLRELRSGQLSTPANIALADQRAAEAHERWVAAHLAAANAHELAAQIHDDAAIAGLGDEAQHRAASARLRAERDAEYTAVEEAGTTGPAHRKGTKIADLNF
jgi:hypothetical protein